MTRTEQTRLPIATLITLAAATLTASLGISIASVLLPKLTQVFSATVSGVQWIVLIYLMSITIAIVPAGRLGDLYGHRRVFTCGLLIFIVASVLCATAPDLGVLIAGRALQGLGGAVLIALPMSMARDLVPTERLGTAMGLLGMTSAAGTALGPSLGGGLLSWSDWRMAFWLLAALGTATLILAVTALPRNPATRVASIKELDLPGTFVLAIALSAYALATSGDAAGILIQPMMLFAVALIGVALFVIVETRVSSPLVPLRLLRDRTTCIGFVMNMTVGTVMMSTLVVGPFFLAFSLGLNVALVGLVLAVGPAVSALSGVPAGRLTDRVGASRVILIGLLQAVFGLLCLAFLPLFFGVGGYVVALVVLTPAFQLFLAANNTLVMVGSDKKQRGRLSGLLGLSRNLGLMTGASAIPALFVGFLGTGNVAEASARDVAHAFSLTFVVAASLAMVTLSLAIYGRAGLSRGVTPVA
ncbi:Multidrug resistance protein stp [Roseovarius sp. THAF8]|uniref:MFS transporter n=1 Tax=Roseovarius sp. THAF8 TaxID=2587846 RepID=UPI00126801EA|nr:MFS transporter [Roseovarius sp. THAF8]QFT97668.1 Multidrug resistance protein stp [Roseovarius sp. THAF8]